MGSITAANRYPHVDDCVDAVLLGLNDESWPVGMKVFNIGTEERTNVMEIARPVARAKKVGEVKVRASLDFPEGRGWAGDVKTMQLEIGRIKEHSWRPKTNSSEAVQLAIEQLLVELGD